MSADSNDLSDQVPTELRELLIQFSLAFLIERPNDIIDYGVAYFQRLKNKRNLNQTQENLRESCGEDVCSCEENDLNHIRVSEVVDSTCEEFITPIDSLTTLRLKSNEDVSSLYDSLQDVSIFRSVSDGSLHEMINRIVCRRITPNEYVFREGERGDTFYIVKSGTFEVYRNNKLLNTYVDRGGFGELALLYAAPRNCTVKAVTKGVLWQIDRQCFRSILFHNQAKYEELLDRLDLFKKLTQDEKIKLADAIIQRKFECGTKIYSQGDNADGMYFIQRGNVSIRKKAIDASETEEIQMNLDEGDVFGELGLFTGSRATSAYAIGNVHAAFLDISAFNRLIGAKIAMNEED